MEPTLDTYRGAATLRTALRRFSRRSEKIAREEGLTPRQHLLLLLIRGAPDGSGRATVTDLSRRLALGQSTVTELVRRAEAAGFVEREASVDDGRVSWLRVTDEGGRRLAAVVTRLGPERQRLREALEGLED
jgi:DNA-binding MarR family transcriptional regulator